ncbi:LysR family transcriptional regulator [Blastococcus sp. TF02A_35]|uniref:LysR family transcriptional regulator n=1 Tax=Blastococcus sp. TF02A-35 TaxID=2559612 RepID=UPI001ADDA78E|nr:LysR family transcriptional regulator [Blastococcus sp. TF02A_35]
MLNVVFLRQSQLSLVHLSSFLRVAELASVTKAAAESGYTQSAVSLHLKALERSLGTPLFHRDRAGMPLTVAGQQILDEVRALMQAVDALRRRSQLLRQQLPATGPVTCLGACPAIPAPRLAGAVSVDEP